MDSLTLLSNVRVHLNASTTLILSLTILPIPLSLRTVSEALMLSLTILLTARSFSLNVYFYGG